MIAQAEAGSRKIEQLVVEEVRAVWGVLMGADSGEAAERMVVEWSRKVGQAVLQAGLQARVEAVEQEASRECECGGRRYVHSRRWRSVVTLLAVVRVRRRYLRCDRCGAMSFPADQWLGWRDAFSRGVQEAVAWLSATLPYRQALAGLRRLCGVELSLSAAERIVAHWGREPLPRSPYEQRVKGRLVVEIDGTTAHLEDGWREVKLGTCMELYRGRPREITYVADWLSAEEFAQPLYQEALARGAPTARALAVVADGAPWIWNIADTLFPRSVQILDWYHACEHLWQAGRVVHGESTPDTAALVERWNGELMRGHSEAVEAELRQLATSLPDPEHTLRKTADYLATHQARLRYHLFRAARWPIGSGVAEGGCKHLIDVRLKRKSTRWTKPGGRAVLNLRLDILNERWEQRCDYLPLAA